MRSLAGGTLKTNDPGKPPRPAVPNELGRRPELHKTDHARLEHGTSPERSGESPTVVTEDVRAYALEKGLEEAEALEQGLKEKSAEFQRAGGELYAE